MWNKNLQKVNISGKNGVRISLYTGNVEYGFQERWSTLHFYHAYQGDYIKINSDVYEFAIAEYSLEWEPWYTYTYFYDKEENWSTYVHNLTPESYSPEKYIFKEECYFRINCKRIDGTVLKIEEENKIAESLIFYSINKEYKRNFVFKKKL